MRLTPFAMAAALFFSPAWARADTFTCTGIDPTMHFEIPPGMKADMTAGRAHNTCVVLEVLNTNFNSSPALIYPTYATLNVPTLPNDHVDLDKFINNDVSNFRSKSPDLRIGVIHDVVTEHGDTFIVRDFLNGARPDSFEEVAYLPMGRGVLVFVLSTTNADDLARYALPFRSLLMHVAFARPSH